MSNEKALEAAHKALEEAINSPKHGSPIEYIVNAYLSALVPDEVAGVVRELADRAERRAATEGPFTKENLVEYRAASLLTALAARAEKAERDAEEARRWASEWHRVCQTIATVMDLPEPEGATFAGAVRDRVATLEAENSELRAKLETVEAETLEEAARAIDGLDVGPEFDGVIVEAIEVVRSLKDKDQQNG